MAENLGFLLDDTARLFRRSFNTLVREAGISALQWRMLAYLKHHPGARQGVLADIIEVEPITLSRMIDRLAERGLVERRSDPADRRAWKLFLTADANGLIENGRSIATSFANDVTQGLSAREVDELVALVDRVRSNLSRHMPATTPSAMQAIR